MVDEKCCVVQCERPLDDKYWDAQYIANTIGWDLGEVSPPLKNYFKKITNKNAAILIPGCGNTYEAQFLLQEGFTNITVIDIAPTLVKNLQQKFTGNSNIKVLLGDFFNHEGQYDYIIEQTFFCALPPSMRQQYVFKMHQLLKQNGFLIGLLFNRTFEAGPPFGGTKNEYELLFKNAFRFLQNETALNSITPRANTELFVELQKNSKVVVNLYNFEGFTCSGCVAKVSENYYTIDDVLNISVSSNFSEILLVSKSEIELEILQKAIAYDAKYKIKKNIK
jgi:methyl halide transferase